MCLKFQCFAMIDELTEALFSELEIYYRANGDLSDELLSKVNFMFPDIATAAFDLIDRDSITKIGSPNGREVFRVKGRLGIHCLLDANYCPCPSFKNLVVQCGESTTCKHVLASRLGTAMNKFQTQTVTNEQMVEILFNIE